MVTRTGIKKRRMHITNRKKVSLKTKKVRLAIECTPTERKYMKMLAAHEEKTLGEFVLESVRMRFERCSHSHTPNKETAATLTATEKKKGLIQFDSLEDFFKSLEK